MLAFTGAPGCRPPDSTRAAVEGDASAVPSALPSPPPTASVAPAQEATIPAAQLELFSLLDSVAEDLRKAVPRPRDGELVFDLEWETRKTPGEPLFSCKKVYGGGVGGIWMPGLTARELTNCAATRPDGRSAPVRVYAKKPLLMEAVESRLSTMALKPTDDLVCNAVGLSNSSRHARTQTLLCAVGGTMLNVMVPASVGQAVRENASRGDLIGISHHTLLRRCERAWCVSGQPAEGVKILQHDAKAAPLGDWGTAGQRAGEPGGAHAGEAALPTRNGESSSTLEQRIACLESRCEACTTDRAMIRWGSPQACLPHFQACALGCGCAHFGNVSSLADVCR